MYTIFSCPKDFTSLFGVIQRNAINSWLSLNSRPNILLFGIEDDQIKKEFNHKKVTFLPIDDFNEYKTPYISKIFETAMLHSQTDTLCYVNSDIILFDDFSLSIENLKKKNNYFGVGRRYNIEINKILNFENKNDIRNKYLNSNEVDSYNGSDYFIFDKDSIKNIPRFLIGRTCWDNWLMHYASKRNLNLTDCTDDIFCVHQKHDYSHIKTNIKKHYKGIEREYNFRQLGGLDRLYTVKDSNYYLKNGVFKKNLSIKIIIHKFLRIFKILFLKEFIYLKIISVKNYFFKN